MKSLWRCDYNILTNNSCVVKIINLLNTSSFVVIQLMFALLLLSILPLNSYCEPFLVKTIYFRPTDAPPIEKVKDDIIRWMTKTQDFYRSEMIRNSFQGKTFKLKRLPDNQIKIYVINAKHNSAHYSNDTYNKMRPELPLEFENPNEHDWQDNIHVYLLGSVRAMDGWASGYGWGWSGGRYGGICVNAIQSRNTDQGMIDLIFHEMGHTLGLYHKPPNTDWNKLEHYEARWLNESHFFNDDHGNRGWNGTLPRMIKHYDTISKGKDILSIKFDLEGLNGLHQAQIFRVSNITVLSHHYFDGSKFGTAIFNISRKLVSEDETDLIMLQVMDKDGNFIMQYITINISEPKNKNPDLDIKNIDMTKNKNEDLDNEDKGEPISLNPKNKLTLTWAKLKIVRE